jgi:glyoxylase-like metal-dependent hydrolase (beta-lactamase superfamily II)
MNITRSPLSLIFSILISSCAAVGQPKLPASVSFMAGPVNGVVIERNGHSLVVYGDSHQRVKGADKLLLTHARRDVIWASYDLVRRGTQAIAPANETDWLEEPQAFWNAQIEDRFHDYAQQSTRLPTVALPIARKVVEGDVIHWEGLTIDVIETPGYTRGSVSYLLNIDGVRIAFVGDLIYGEGQLFDLYSLQDAVPEENIRGYHGYAARLGQLVESLNRIRAESPQFLIPARGPLVEDPAEAIDTLIARVRSVYAEYLSISAGRWYFKEAYDALAKRVLGEQGKVRWMPWADRIDEKPPAWIVPIQNSRLILSEGGRGFLVDCGYRSMVTRLLEMRQAGTLAGLDGLFITHYHDDHTDAVAELVKEFDCPVYACDPLVDVLKNPAKYRLPAMTSLPILEIRTMPHEGTLTWEGFTFTFYDFPGQTIYHDALLVESNTGERVMFIGDSFTPSGIDDYCLLNRNLIHESSGYLRCLDLLKTIEPKPLLINQHVREPFRFSEVQLDRMKDSLLRRAGLLRDLFAWNDANEGIDERWVQLLPYGQTVAAGETVSLLARVMNHSDEARAFRLRPNAPSAWRATPDTITVMVPPRVQREVEFSIEPDPSVRSGVHIVTLDVAVEEWDLRRWCEGIIEVRSFDGGRRE